jgi:adenylosuccinate lyase
MLGEKKFFKNNIKLNNQLRQLVNDFNTEDAMVIKKTEAITNHDVKAVEYFLKDKLETLGAAAIKEWVHFGLTSQDINNTAVPLLW